MEAARGIGGRGELFSAPLPDPRGPVSQRLLTALSAAPTSVESISIEPVDPLLDEDLQLSLYLCYELHYRGFQGVDPAWEWEPLLLALRSRLERCFSDALRQCVPRHDPVPAEVGGLLFELAASTEQPS